MAQLLRFCIFLWLSSHFRDCFAILRVLAEPFDNITFLFQVLIIQGFIDPQPAGFFICFSKIEKYSRNVRNPKPQRLPICESSEEYFDSGSPVWVFF